MTQYRLDTSKLKSYVGKENKHIFRLLILGFLTVIVVQLPNLKNEFTSNGNIIRELLSFFVFLLLSGLLYFLRKKYTTLVAENLLIIIDEQSITKKIDLENTPQLNLVNIALYNVAKRNTYGYNTCIEFNQINLVTYKKGDLWIYAVASNSFTGKNVLIVPQEIERFDEIDCVIKNRIR